MRIAMHLFLGVVYLGGVVDTGSGVSIWPLIDDRRIIYHHYTFTTQERPRYQWAHETTHAVREV